MDDNSVFDEGWTAGYAAGREEALRAVPVAALHFLRGYSLATTSPKNWEHAWKTVLTWLDTLLPPEEQPVVLSLGDMLAALGINGRNVRLIYLHGVWLCDCGDISDKYYVWEEGKTPEEAVERIWRAVQEEEREAEKDLLDSLFGEDDYHAN